MPVTLPSPRTWTLRFKNDRSTILLHVDPLQKLSLIRGELLKALRETNPDGTFNGEVVPTDPDDILLAKPIDPNDLSKGWQELEPQDDFESGELGGKGKGKAVLTNAGKGRKKGACTTSPQASGLKNGAFVAFKFRATGSIEHRDGGEVYGDEELIAEPLEIWDVVLPSMDDLGDEDEIIVPPDMMELSGSDRNSDVG